MAESLRARLRDSIDYAGTFPPASLSLEQAAQNYSAYRRQRESWMLGRMVCPASQLAEIAAVWESEPPVEDSPRVREGAVSALLSGGETAEAGARTSSENYGWCENSGSGCGSMCWKCNCRLTRQGRGVKQSWPRCWMA